MSQAVSTAVANEALSTAVVIPAYNEAATIAEVVNRTLAQQENHPQLMDIIVVDDGSTDATVAQLSGLPITLLRNEKNSGKAATLWRGIQYALTAGAAQVITLDGDGQHTPEDIPALLAAAAARPDQLIIAARLKENERAPRERLFANRFADFWISWAAGQRIRDTQSGYRLYPATVLHALRPNTDRARSFVFESECLIDAARAGFTISEVAIATLYREGARPSHLNPWRDISRIVRMVAWKLLIRGFFPQGLWRSLRG